MLSVTHLVLTSALKSPYWEPEYQEHFQPLRQWRNNHIPNAKIPRLRNITENIFKKYIENGQPFVVDDCGHGSDPLRSWSCQDFSTRFPEGKMRAEYSDGQRPINLKQPEWYSRPRATRAESEHMSGGKRIPGPYIWHCKDHEAGTSCSSKDDCWPVKEEMQRHFRTPYFLNDKTVNSREVTHPQPQPQPQPQPPTLITTMAGIRFFRNVVRASRQRRLLPCGCI